MKRALGRLYKREIAEPIWVANHFRAIADIVMMDQITLMSLHRMRPNVPTFIRRVTGARRSSHAMSSSTSLVGSCTPSKPASSA